MLTRFYQDLDLYLKPQRALIIFGPRRAGKTTILENYLANTTFKYKLENGDNFRFRELMSSHDFNRIIEYAEGYELIAIDEAQMIPNIGQSIKILVDQVSNLRVIATGSSSFELSQSVGEPLTGRKQTLKLYPLSQLELRNIYNTFELKEKLEEFLIYGQYPEVILAKNKKEKIQYLNELVDSYLLKDILALEKVKGSEALLKLLKLLAFQVGQLVSINELATQLNLDVKTVGRYLDLLEKGFVLFKLTGYSSNLRKEVTKKHKYYFLDNGIRNAIIAQFNNLDMRNDIGALWENFLVIERLKKQTYHDFYGSQYFLRTYDQKEVDLIEEYEGKLCAFEFKLKSQQVSKKLNEFWQTTYNGLPIKAIHSDNYLDFLL